MKKLVFMFVLLYFPSIALSFPFRAVELGGKIPAVELKKIDGQSFSLSPTAVKGKGLILLFWGADSNGKKERAIKTMKILNDVAANNQQIEVVAINEGDAPEVVNEVTSQVNPPYPVLLDKDLKSYQAFGVFITPSVLIVNEQGQIKAGFGYSNTIRNTIETEALLLLGKISEQEAKKDLVVEVVEKPEEERRAMMHLQLGRRLQDKGMPDKAKEEYQQAVELFDLAEAHIRLGVVLLEADDLQGAEPAIKKGLALDPDSLDAKIAYARLRTAKGEVEGVLEELQALSLKFPNDDVLRCALGSAYEAKGDLENATKEYKKAFELLRRHGAEE